MRFTEKGDAITKYVNLLLAFVFGLIGADLLLPGSMYSIPLWSNIILICLFPCFLVFRFWYATQYYKSDEYIYRRISKMEDTEKPRGLYTLAKDSKINRFAPIHKDFVLIPYRDSQIALLEDKVEYYKDLIKQYEQDGRLFIDEYLPLLDKPCKKCGAYGLIYGMHIGQYICANCGDISIQSPSVKLHARADEDE